MNTKIIFLHADNFDLGAQGCGFNQQRDFIVMGDGYTFGDWLSDRGARFAQESGDPDTYFILDDDLRTETRTGEAFRIISRTPTDEELKA